MKFFLTFILFACSNCFAAEIEPKDLERALSSLTFLYSCPEKDYKAICINGDKKCSEIGLAGCDRKVIYTRIGSNLVMSYNFLNSSLIPVNDLAKVTGNVAASYTAHQAAMAARASAAQAAALLAHQAALAGANAAMAAQNAAMAGPPPM